MIRCGDIVPTRTVETPTLFNRLTDGATATAEIPFPPHHVQTVFDSTKHFSSQPPYATMVPNSEMVAEQKRRVWAAYRWHGWIGREDSIEYREYQAACRGAMLMAEELRVPYDHMGTVSLAWDSVRRRIPILRHSTWMPHSDKKFFCVENVASVQRKGGIDLFTLLPPQRLYAPVHFARLILIGEWVLVEDHGLHSIICQDVTKGVFPCP